MTFNPLTTARPLDGGVTIVMAVNGPLVACAVTCMVAGTAADAFAVWAGPEGAGVAVMEFEEADAEPAPALFVATTVKVYDVPFVSPVTTMGEDKPVAVMPPGDEVTM